MPLHSKLMCVFSLCYPKWLFCQNLTFWYIQASWGGEKKSSTRNSSSEYSFFFKKKKQNKKRVQCPLQTLTYIFAWTSMSSKWACTVSSPSVLFLGILLGSIYRKSLHYPRPVCFHLCGCTGCLSSDTTATKKFVVYKWRSHHYIMRQRFWRWRLNWTFLLLHLILHFMQINLGCTFDESTNTAETSQICLISSAYLATSSFLYFPFVFPHKCNKVPRTVEYALPCT